MSNTDSSFCLTHGWYEGLFCALCNGNGTKFSPPAESNMPSRVPPAQNPVRTLAKKGQKQAQNLAKAGQVSAPDPMDSTRRSQANKKGNRLKMLSKANISLSNEVVALRQEIDKLQALLKQKDQSMNNLRRMLNRYFGGVR